MNHLSIITKLVRDIVWKEIQCDDSKFNIVSDHSNLKIKLQEYDTNLNLKLSSALTKLGYVFDMDTNSKDNTTTFTLSNYKNALHFFDVVTDVKISYLKSWWLKEIPKYMERIVELIPAQNIDEYNPTIRYFDDWLELSALGDNDVINHSSLAFTLAYNGDIVILKSRYNKTDDVKIIEELLFKGNPYKKYHVNYLKSGYASSNLLENIQKAHLKNKNPLLYLENRKIWDATNI